MLSVEWKHPGENIQSVAIVVAISEVKNNYNRDFSESAYADKILFKEERRGTSFLNFELAVIKDADIFRKVFSALIDAGVGKIANPFVGAGIGAIVKELKYDEKQVTAIGKGSVEIEASESGLSKNITLRIPEKLVVYSTDSDDFDDIFDEENEDVTVLKEKTTNGNVVIQIESL